MNTTVTRPRDICAAMVDEAEARFADPEAVEVSIVPTTEAIARSVAPAVAERLYPGRIFGRVVYAEPRDDGGWYVAVADLGIRGATTRGIPAPR